MQRTIVLVLIATSAVFAQTDSKTVVFTGGKVGAAARFGQVSGQVSISDAPVQGSPYTATITNESVQTLADGNRIVQTSTGTTARDSMGRTRRDMPLPTIGNMSPANAPQIVFIQDPVAETSYTLNLSDKTAMKMPPLMPFPSARSAASAVPVPAPAGRAAGLGMVTRVAVAPDIAIGGQAETFAVSGDGEFSKPQTENLGSQTMEGTLVNGARTTMTIPAGQIGNDKPIFIVTEIWTSPELKTIVYSKRGDPRMGDQTFKLTNINRAEPDPSLFTVPPDFKITDARQPILYKERGPAQ